MQGGLEGARVIESHVERSISRPALPNRILCDARWRSSSAPRTESHHEPVPNDTLHLTRRSGLARTRVRGFMGTRLQVNPNVRRHKTAT